MESISFFDIILIALSIWKIHDLCFKFWELRAERVLNEKLIRFYAEHTYKVMNNKKEYNEAPQEIYDWLTDSFIEWQEYQSNNKE